MILFLLLFLFVIGNTKSPPTSLPPHISQADIETPEFKLLQERVEALFTWPMLLGSVEVDVEEDVDVEEAVEEEVEEGDGE